MARPPGFLARLLAQSGKRQSSTPRTSGRPPSANGASSLHLAWDVPSGVELAEAAVTITVPQVPAVPRLYFWALQASFVDGGAAHLGLQWGADPPRRMHHVNWGGYGPDGKELAGTPSGLPSSFGNPHTRDFDWQADRQYRLRICRGAQGWAGWVDDTMVRELLAPGATLAFPVVWSEVFADCDHPTVSVRWSDPEVVSRSGTRMAVSSAVAHYQPRSEGGCDNTSSAVEGDAFVQRTSTDRVTALGTRLHLG